MRGRRKIIVVYGAGSGSGKTSLASGLLRRLPGWAAVKVTPGGFYESIVLETPATARPGKDTSLFMAAGADPVLHVRAPRGEMGEVLERALELVPEGRPVLLEGREAAARLEPDLAIMVWRPGTAAKEEPGGLAAGADVLFVNLPPEGSPPAEGVPTAGEVVTGCLRDGLGEREAGELLRILAARGVA